MFDAKFISNNNTIISKLHNQTQLVRPDIQTQPRIYTYPKPKNNFWLLEDPYIIEEDFSSLAGGNWKDLEFKKPLGFSGKLNWDNIYGVLKKWFWKGVLVMCSNRFDMRRRPSVFLWSFSSFSHSQISWNLLVKNLSRDHDTHENIREPNSNFCIFNLY